ncbi:copper-binding protein [Devosia sp.]|uniref:copper-binding protein n=1 Tax=Devosia sp. TaxID=1871048 RepID=UPI002FCAECFD
MKTVVLSVVAALAMSSAAAAQSDHSGHAAPKAAPSAALVEGVGVVKKVDVKAGTVTLAHDPIKALNWPAMTMPFKVSDKALLAKAAVGSKVRFQLSGQTIVGIRAF